MYTISAQNKTHYGAPLSIGEEILLIIHSNETKEKTNVRHDTRYIMFRAFNAFYRLSYAFLESIDCVTFYRIAHVLIESAIEHISAVRIL